MVEFIRIQYRLGRLTAEQVRSMAPKWITADQAKRLSICDRPKGRKGKLL